MAMMLDWYTKGGFRSPPEHKLAPADGLVIYRAWGAKSSEWGTGFFSLEKPTSVLDAELRFRIVDWGNGVNFVSTFRLKQGFGYFVGDVAHGLRDLSLRGKQVYVPSPFVTKVERIGTWELLPADAFVIQRGGTAGLKAFDS